MTLQAKLRIPVLMGASALVLTACATGSPERAAQGARPHNTAAAQGAGRYKVGAPYMAGGVWYVPAEQPDYDEVGVASWYGDEFHGKPTANGERFDMYTASAAHTTLPMPSIVEVTNLDNGRKIQVRLNDRGPFKAGRIIDLSREAAQELGYLNQGTARVRVRYIGPAKLDGSLEPLYVADARSTPTARLAAAQAAPAPAAAEVSWRPTAPSAPIMSAPLPPPVAPPRPYAAPTYAASTYTAPAYTAPTYAAPASTQPAYTVPVAYTPAAQTGFVVQAGAFSDPDKAQRIADSLAATGYAAVRPLDLPDRRLYRVVLGPWAEETRAAAARSEVVALGYADARVVKAF